MQSLALLGYEFPPRLSGRDRLGKNSSRDGDRQAVELTGVYSDPAGNLLTLMPHDQGVFALPFVPGSPAELSQGPFPEQGGFVPIEKMPQMPAKAPPGLPIGMTPGFNPNAPHPLSGSSGAGPSEPGFEDMLAGMMRQMGPQMTADWLGQAAAQSIVAGGCTGVMDSALNVLGVSNPLASGPLAGVLGAALQKAGVGELGSLMPGLGSALMGGSTAGLANAMGRQGVNSLLAAAGLSNIPGASFVANALGNEIGEQLQNMFTGGLDSLTGDLSASLGELSVDGFVADAENAINNIDVNAIGSQGLDMAADQLMSAWKVDDESSAAEHIAQRALKENMEDLKGLAKDELLGGKGGGIAGLRAKIAKFFEGEAPGACLPVIRMGDMDDGADVSLMGVANILVEKQPVSRITDMVAGPKAPPPGKPILEGAATVLSAELPTAFVSSEVAVPSMMIKGAATVFLGGAIASIAPPKPKLPNVPNKNAGPAGPAGPSNTSSSSDGANVPGSLSADCGGNVDLEGMRGARQQVGEHELPDGRSVPIYKVPAETMKGASGYYDGSEGAIYLDEDQFDRTDNRLNPFSDADYSSSLKDLTPSGIASLANEVQHAQDDGRLGSPIGDGIYLDEDGQPLSYLEREARSDDASVRAIGQMPDKWDRYQANPNKFKDRAASMRAADQHLQQEKPDLDAARNAAGDNAACYVERAIEAKQGSYSGVKLCKDEAQLPGNQILGIEHHWLKTPNMEVGLGQAGAGVPGLNGAGGAATEWWNARGQTTMNDHSGRSSAAGATCTPVPNADVACVERELADKRTRGVFPITNCQNEAQRIIDKCSPSPPSLPACPPGYPLIIPPGGQCDVTKMGRDLTI
jgi:uncharacterized Zn-binding protein involved in type VI secretion